MDEELWGQEIETENDGPALPGWKPIQERVISPLGQRQGTENKGLQMGSINLADFIRPATPEEIRRGDELHRRRVEYAQNSGIVDSIVHDVIHNTFEDDLELWETNPNEAARRFKMAKATGLSGDALKDPDIMSWAQREYARGLGLLDLQNAPERVVEWLANPGMMEIARDDIKVLSALGKALERLGASRAPEREGGLVERFRRGISNVLEGWSQRDALNADMLEVQAQEKLSDADAIREAGLIAIQNGDPFGFSLFEKNVDDLHAMRKEHLEADAKQKRGFAEGWGQRADWIRPEPFLNATGLWGFLGDIAEGMPYTLSGLPGSWAMTAAGATLGGPLGAAVGALAASLWQTHGEAETEQAGVYHQLIQNGMDRREAYEKSLKEVYWPNFGLLLATNYIENMASFGAPIVPVGPGVKGWIGGVGKALLFGKGDPVNPLSWGRRFWNFALSSGMEGVEEISQGLISNRALGQENNWSELLYEGAVGVANGLVFTGAGTAMNKALGTWKDHRSAARSAQRAERAAQFFDEALQAVKASEVLKRTPEAMSDFVQYVTDNNVPAVTMDAETFMQVMGPEAQQAAEELGITDGLREALSTGGAVEIGKAALITHPEISEQIKRDVRFEEDGMSLNEAEAFEKEAPERQKALVREMEQAAQKVREAGEEAARVQEGFRAQIEALGKFSKKDAELVSVLYTKSVMDFARAAGISIEEAAKRPELNIRFQFDRENGARGGNAYAQIIGERGAAKLDATDAGHRIDNLGVARQMEEAGKDAKTIWLATGWQRGKEGKWNYEVLDGKINTDLKLPKRLAFIYGSALGETVRETTLGELYDAPELYAAYPELKNTRVIFQRLEGGKLGRAIWDDNMIIVSDGYSSQTSRSNDTRIKEIEATPEFKAYNDAWLAAEEAGDEETLNRIDEEWEKSELGAEYNNLLNTNKIQVTEVGRPNADMKGTLIHEIQHLVQAIEGFGKGGSENTGNVIRSKASAWSWRNQLKLYAEKHPDIAGTLELQDRMVKEFNDNGLDFLVPSEYERDKGFNLYVRGYDNEGYEDAYNLATKGKVGFVKKSKDFKTYNRLAGEVQARNAEARMNMTAEERRQKLLSETEDVAREDQILLFGDGKAESRETTAFPRVEREERGEYDEDDPATWPEGPARDEALELKAWLDWDMLEDYKYLPDSVPEKAEALALMKEFNELDAWFEAADIETVKNDVEHNDRQNQIEKRLDEIDRILKKKMPKGAERRLEKLIEAEAQEAEREFQLYDEMESETESFAHEQTTEGLLPFKLTGAPVSDAYMAALAKLEAGESITAEEYNAIPEIQSARERVTEGSTLNMPERDAIRQQVYDKLMSYGSAVTEVVDGRERTVYNGKVRNERRADIIIGLPASGKSSALVDPISKKYKSMLIDSDEAKKLIPEFDDGFGAGYVHEESKNIVNRVYDDATVEGRNIVIPIVGSDYAKLKEGYIDDLRQKGYKVYVHMADIDPNIAMGRNLRRFAETGRFVDLAATSFKYGKKPLEVFERVKKEGIADGYSRVDTSVFPGSQIEGTEDISYDRGALREGRGRVLEGAARIQGGESGQTGGGTAGTTGLYLGQEEAWGNSREGTAPRTVYESSDGMTTRGYVEFEAAETVVHVLKTANRSTLLHELGHVFLNSRRALSMMEGVEDSVREDWTTLVQWLGIEDIDFSKPLSEADRKRWKNAHEKFAAGFEKYLMEGTAPSTALAKAFRAFRKWLTDIYRAVKNIVYIDADGNAQSFELSDDVRAVMDRMLASEDEIENSRAVRDAAELAKTLKEQGIPDDVAAKYQDQIQAAQDKAKARLMKKLTAELKKEKQEELKAARKEAKKRVAAEVWEQPEYKALKALRRPLDKGGVRLSMPDLVSLYGDSEARKLAGELPFGVVANDGLSLDAAAELLGYPNADALVEDLKKAKAIPPAKAISERVKMETAELESLANNPEALRAEAEKALHGKERADWVAMEMEMLAQAAGKVKEKITEDARREARQEEKKQQKEEEERMSGAAFSREVFSRENVAAWTRAAEETAKRIIAGKRMRDISPARYLAAEKRAAEKALRAAGGARFEEAVQEKRAELINHALAEEAMRVREEYEAGRRYLEKFWANRKRLRGAMGNDAFDQVIGLLARVGINQEDERAKDRPRLGDYLNGLPDDVKLAAPQWLLDMDVKDQRFSVTNMTMEEFFDVRDLVKQIEHVGRMERNLIAQQETENFDEVVAELAEATVALHGEPGPQSIDPNDTGAGVLKQGLATLERTETIIRRADGMKEQGPWWETFMRPVHRANDREIKMRTAAAAKIAELFKKHFPDKAAARKFLSTKMDTGLVNPKDGSKVYWTGENLLSAMLNWGNQHNRERLVFGNGFVENALGMKTARPADDAQYYAFYEAGADAAERVFAKLGNDEMWGFCQDVWDLIDIYWPDIRALEEKMTGVAPEKVEPSPVKTASGKVLRGGYYPVKFDSNKDWHAFVWNEKENAKALYEDQFHRAGTRHGHTKERVERVAPRAVSLKLNVIPEHIGNVIHDIAFRPVVRDLNKLVNDGRVRDLLIHAAGREPFKQINPWIQALAAPEGVTDGGERFMGKLIGHVMTSALGFNIPTRFMQLANFARAGYKLGYGNIIRAVGNALTGRILWDPNFRESAYKMSPELEDRLRANQRDMGQILGVYLDGKWDRTMSDVQAAAMFGLNWADAIVAVPIWHVAYDKGMRMFNDQRKAIDYADQMTRLTNNTTQRKDAAAVLRGGSFKKLFTMFYNAANTSYNLFLEEWTRAKMGTAIDKVRFVGFLFAVFTVEAMIQSTVKRRAPWNDDEWDKEDKAPQIAKWMAQGTLADFSAMFPLVRDMVSATYAAGGRGASAYRMTPAGDLGETTVKSINAIWKFGRDAWDGKETKNEAAAKAVMDLAGVGLGLPAPGVYKFCRTFCRWLEGSPNYSPLDWIWGPRGK